ncbi:MAG TPA: DedA family protein [Actinomycetota bacterium]|nr:DedA family protein [Actinomycetota bacterium]
MVALIQELVDWVGPAFAAAGYIIIATAVALERSAFLGLFVPGDVVMALGGIYAARNDLELVPVMIVGFVASLIGESVGFWLGNRYGVRLIRHLPLVNRLEGKIEAGKKHFARRGVLTVVVGRYATGAGSFVPFVVGMEDMPFWKFILIDVFAVAVWAIGLPLVGYTFGRNLELVDSILSQFGWVMLAVLVLAVVGRFLWKRYRTSRS